MVMQHYKKIIPHPGVFFLVKQPEAEEAILRDCFPQDRPEVENIWICELPAPAAERPAYGVLIYLVTPAGILERWRTIEDVDLMARGLPAPSQSLDTAAWTSEQLAKIRHAVATAESEASTWSVPKDGTIDQLLKVADDLLKELRGTTQLVNYYRDSRASWQEMCATAANRYAQERDAAEDRLRTVEGQLRDATSDLAEAEKRSRSLLRALRTREGTVHLRRFCNLLPMRDVRIEVPTPIGREALYNCDRGIERHTLLEDIHKIVAEDLGPEAGAAHVRVLYFAQGSSFARFFTPLEIEHCLERAENRNPSREASQHEPEA